MNCVILKKEQCSFMKNVSNYVIFAKSALFRTATDSFLKAVVYFKNGQ